MKTIKSGIVFLFTLLLVSNFSFSQDQPPTMYHVHMDNVKFSKMQQYEEVAKEMNNALVEHKIQSTWNAFSISDGRYVFSTPIEKMADLDKNPMGALYEKMGKEKADAMFKKMNECYDSHTDYIVHYSPELSYSPDNAAQGDDYNYREYHFMYYAPKDSNDMYEGMKAVKELFKSKGIVNGYSVYYSGFGSPESYYMVSISGKNPVELAQNGEANDKKFGDEGQATFYKVIGLTTKYDKLEGRYRPDLSYYPKQE